MRLVVALRVVALVGVLAGCATFDANAPNALMERHWGDLRAAAKQKHWSNDELISHTENYADILHTTACGSPFTGGVDASGEPRRRIELWRAQKLFTDEEAQRLRRAVAAVQAANSCYAAVREPEADSGWRGFLQNLGTALTLGGAGLQGNSVPAIVYQQQQQRQRELRQYGSSYTGGAPASPGRSGLILTPGLGAGYAYDLGTGMILVPTPGGGTRAIIDLRSGGE